MCSRYWGWLETEVSEGAVRLGHLVGIVALLDCIPLPDRSFLELAGERLDERDVLASEGVIDDPAHRESELAGRRNFHRHLVGGTTDAAALHLEARLHVVDRLIENFQRINGISAGA